jgi:hypothetical protein
LVGFGLREGGSIYSIYLSGPTRWIVGREREGRSRDRGTRGGGGRREVEKCF